jgi:hypothetical protein
MPKLGLCGIVKNEAGRIERMLDSVGQFIDAVCITDTGSTDDTKDKITAWCIHHHIDFIITDAPFIDWSQARNANLDAAMATEFGVEYWLLVDADMELVVRDRSFLDAKWEAPAYDIEQRAGTCHYMNRRVIRHGEPGRYRGVTHEYLDVPGGVAFSPNEVFFVDHADGSNRPEKFKRDIRLLKAGIVAEPNNERYMFYLAQSYRDAGNLPKAIEWYRKRVEFGGWAEEQWQAQQCIAECYAGLKNEAEFVHNALLAYNMRPTRAEPLWSVAKYYREKGINAPAALFAEVGMQIPRPNDTLFVNDYVYRVGLKEEFAITGYYVPGKRLAAYQTTDKLSLQTGPYGNAQWLARNNMIHYLETLGELCPSFSWQKLEVEPPHPHYTAMNPSVTVHGNKLYCNVRFVNYRMDEQGRYLIKATDGTANAENPIDTKNVLVFLKNDLTPYDPFEIGNPEDFPCGFPLVTGFEDMRLFSFGPSLYVSATVRQIHPDGNCEQVLARLGDGTALHDMKRMLRMPRSTEKNWAPIASGKEIQFMWRPGHVVDTDGKDVKVTPNDLTLDRLSGSSQVIPYLDGYLAILHEAQTKPGSHLRYYYHRFALYNKDFALARLSKPYVFNEKEIEFCAGMCLHPDGKRFVISYGFKDCEARIATVSCEDIDRLLWAPR